MDVVRQVFSVLLVFALLGSFLWVLRRRGRISFRTGPFARALGKRVLRSTRSMVTLERLALTPQHTLHIVRIHEREVLVVTHPKGCSIITELAERKLRAQA